MSTPSASSRTFWEPPSPEALQAAMPQYEVTEFLGRGGMGAVYKGRQISLERPVAIKILSKELDEREQGFAERFKNEARAMAKLNHPGIIAVYEFGETADGLLYIVMEYVEGTDVARMIARNERLTVEHALAITTWVCDALAYAHARGIVHRDIKPANIMVSADGAVKVADFGLAKVRGSNGETLGLTQSGMAMGTLHYMAPEALMLGSAVDHRADIYAVGVMLYQMLTGKLPQGMFKLPSRLVPGLDARFDEIIARAMREDRDTRHQSAAELRSELDGIHTHPMVRQGAGSSQMPFSRAPENVVDSAVVEMEPRVSKRSWVGGVAVFLAAGVVLAACYLWLNSSSDSGVDSTTTISTVSGSTGQDTTESEKPPPTASLGTATSPTSETSVAVSPFDSPKPVTVLPTTTRKDANAPATMASRSAPSAIYRWTDINGRVVEAAFGGVVDTDVLLKADGRGFLQHSMSKLSAESQALAQRLENETKSSNALKSTEMDNKNMAAPTTAVSTSSATHVWTDASGRVMSAAFGGVVDGNVLFKVGERSFLVAMSKLSSESQALARKLEDGTAFEAPGNLPPSYASRCSPQARLERILQNGGSEEVEQAVTKSLAWLKTKQNTNGSWGRNNKAAYTGFALQCYLARCEGVDSIGNGTTVMKGILYLIEVGSKNPHGILSDLWEGGKNGFGVYEHAIATTALGEACILEKAGGTSTPGLVEAFTRAVQVILDNQNKRGSWTYGGKEIVYNNDSSGEDLSISNWHFQALRSARDSGLKLADLDLCISQAVDYIATKQTQDGGFGGSNREAHYNQWSLSGGAIVGLQTLAAGDKNTEIRKGIEFLRSFIAAEPLDWNVNCNLYSWRHYTDAFFLIGGEDWIFYKNQMLSQILSAQQSDGSFKRGRANWPAGDAADEIYRQCLCTLQLEVFYRLAPRY
ncbi:protein kinase [Prosthecobacter sp.]|uniref:serine/threonine-protein kinase n=1 Tax=Prosthecobacter sp. TaxID=1965333 RepID=UPI002ABA4016|nr:protein kinase [Prosthecobacter sp.]MDZ4404079.1 protein kinase [Prosthecobacter sp.]